MIGGRVRWTAMMTKGVSELAVTIICVTKTTRQMSSENSKEPKLRSGGTISVFFFFVNLFAMTKKDLSCMPQLICFSTQDS